MPLTQATANNKFPFEIRKNSRVEYKPYETVIEEKLERTKSSREYCRKGRYHEANKALCGEEHGL